MPRVPRKFNFESYYIRCARYRHERRSKRERQNEKEKGVEEGKWRSEGRAGSIKETETPRAKEEGKDAEEKRKKRGGFAVGQAVRRTASQSANPLGASRSVRVSRKTDRS